MKCAASLLLVFAPLPRPSSLTTSDRLTEATPPLISIYAEEQGPASFPWYLRKFSLYRSGTLIKKENPNYMSVLGSRKDMII